MKRVSKQKLCPVCGKHDWCLLKEDESAAICARIESSQLAKNGVGWWHQIIERDREQSRWRAVSQWPKQTQREIDWMSLSKRQFHDGENRLPSLSRLLGVSLHSLRQLRAGFSNERNAYSFPMRNHCGDVIGIRYRTTNAKFSEAGSREGLFYQPSQLATNYLVIVEGASDSAACMTIGFPSVIGRANCVGNTEQIVSLVRRLSPKQVVVIPDNDKVGIAGATALISKLPASVQCITLPDGIKDVRQCIYQKQNADWLRDQIGEVIKSPRGGQLS